MYDDVIIKKAQRYFNIKELVSEKVYNKYGERAWQFFCPRLLHTLVIIRENIGKPITVNTWHNGGSFSQRGLRSNLGAIFLSKFKKGSMYLSAHVMGKGVDFDVKGMTAVQVREWILKNESLFPYKIRLENKMKGKPISWVHLDVFYNVNNPHIYLFNV